MLVYSVNAQPVTEITDEASYEETTVLSTSTVPLIITTTESNPINTIDILQYQLNQILVQFCASEIDRNKTTSALLKFSQLVDAKTSMKNVVDFYIENYEESFDNLLPFIDQTSSLELQNVAYNTLVEATKLNKINVINLLSFEHFIRTKIERIGTDDIELKTFGDLVWTVGNHIKELIVATDLNRLITVINGSDNPNRIFELIPRIVQGIDLTDFNDMDRIFQFSMQLPVANQIKLIREILSEMRRKNQYQHLFHVILQIRSLRNSRDESVDKCLLTTVENEVPSEMTQLLSGDSRWHIRYIDYPEAYLTYITSPKFSKNLLFVSSSAQVYGWRFESQNSNSVSIGKHGNNNYNQLYLSVAYCFHNESFPIANERDSNDPTQNNWYLLMDNHMSYVQIKNIYTNELLVLDDMKEVGNDGVARSRFALSAQCLDCDGSKFFLDIESSNYSPTEYVCPRKV